MSPEFTQYLARLNEVGQELSTKSGVEIQKIRADILTAYAEGRLSDFEKRHLYGISVIIMGEMRERSSDK